MTYADTLILIANAFSEYGVALLQIFGLLLSITLGVLIFYFGFRAIWHADGTTNWLGSHWSWYDQHTYKPYAGYNRLRSRKWNMQHMP